MTLASSSRSAQFQSDLFGSPTIAGLSTANDFITGAEEASLIAAIGAVDLTPFKFQGWLGKRLTCSFGWHYDFEAARIARAAPIPDFLLPVRERAAQFARLEAVDLVQALVIRYDPGAGIGWHRDRPLFENIIGISLCVPASMRFRRRIAAGFERKSVTLAPRSIYHLRGDVRHEWEHSIVEMDRSRLSITFRSLSESGRRASST